MKIQIILFFIVISTTLFGQLKPDFLPEDFILDDTGEDSDLKNKSRAKGISLSYGLIGSGAYAPIESTVLTDNGSSIDRLSFVDRRKLSKQKFSPTIF